MERQEERDRNRMRDPEREQRETVGSGEQMGTERNRVNGNTRARERDQKMERSDFHLSLHNMHLNNNNNIY